MPKEYYSYIYPVAKSSVDSQANAENISDDDNLIVSTQSSSSSSTSVQAEDKKVIPLDGASSSLQGMLYVLPYHLETIGGFFNKAKVKKIALFNSVGDVEEYLRQYQEEFLKKEEQGQAMIAKITIDDNDVGEVRLFPKHRFSLIAEGCVEGKNIAQVEKFDLRKIEINHQNAQALITNLLSALKEKINAPLLAVVQEAYLEEDDVLQPLVSQDTNPGKNDEERKLYSCIRVLESNIDLKAKMLFLKEFLRMGNGVFSSVGHGFVVDKVIESVEPTYRGARWNRALDLMHGYVLKCFQTTHDGQDQANALKIWKYIHDIMAPKIDDQLTSKAGFSGDLIAELNNVMTNPNFEIPIQTRGCCFTR